MPTTAFSAIRTPHSHLKTIGPDTGIRVLAVDDDQGVRKFVGRVLRDAGYQVTLAADGPEALTLWQTAGPFDLLLADLKMPQMNGDEVARQHSDKFSQIFASYT